MVDTEPAGKKATSEEALDVVATRDISKFADSIGAEVGRHTILGSGQGGHEANGGDNERMHGDSVSLGCVVRS